MTDYVTISHDPFARQSVVRRVSDNTCKCLWCGNHRPMRLSSLGEYHTVNAFEYGTERDDHAGVNWHRGAFCSKACHDSYHG